MRLQNAAKRRPTSSNKETDGDRGVGWFVPMSRESSGQQRLVEKSSAAARSGSVCALLPIGVASRAGGRNGKGRQEQQIRPRTLWRNALPVVCSWATLPFDRAGAQAKPIEQRAKHCRTWPRAMTFSTSRCWR